MSKSGAQIENEIHKSLCRCKLMAKGLWYVMRHAIDEESGKPRHRPGHLQIDGRPVSADQLAIMAGCSAKLLPRPLDQLLACGLIERTGDDVLHSPLLARLAEARAGAARRKRKSASIDRKISGFSPEIGRAGVTSHPNGVSSTEGNAQVTPHAHGDPPSPAPSPPHTPPLTPPPSPGSGACAPGGAALFAENVGRRPRSQRLGSRKPRVLTDDQQAVRLAFSDWWMSAAWPRFHNGQTYGFEGDRDAPAVLRILRHPKVKWDIEYAKKLAIHYLTLKDNYLAHAGFPLPTLAARVNYYASKLAQAGDGASHVLRAADPDPYALPTEMPQRRPVGTVTGSPASGAGRRARTAG